MVRDLLEGFVGGAWLNDLDFSTLARVSDHYTTDDLRSRADDIVWRVRCGDRQLYLLLEFQSRPELFMPVRVLMPADENTGIVNTLRERPTMLSERIAR
jgi:hypothetical protein